MFGGCFELFLYCMNVGAKPAEVVELTPKFAKQCCVGIFHNECTRSTPLDPKLMFWARFETFLYCTKVGAKWSKLVPLTRKFAKRSCIGIFRK
jgi:hypothetical protein